MVPLLSRTPDVSLHDLLGGMHQLLGDAAETAAADADEIATGCGGHTCSCGGSTARISRAGRAHYPALDRHATIFGALESMQPGAGLVTVAPHDPLPLLEQMNQRWPGGFSTAYSERGREAWRLSLVRTDA